MMSLVSGYWPMVAVAGIPYPSDRICVRSTKLVCQLDSSASNDVLQPIPRRRLKSQLT